MKLSIAKGIAFHCSNTSFSIGLWIQSHMFDWNGHTKSCPSNRVCQPFPTEWLASLHLPPRPTRYNYVSTSLFSYFQAPLSCQRMMSIIFLFLSFVCTFFRIMWLHLPYHFFSTAFTFQFEFANWTLTNSFFFNHLFVFISQTKCINFSLNCYLIFFSQEQTKNR